MKISDWLQSTTKQLLKAGISTARLDCLVLLADELERDKSWLLSHADDELQGSILEKLNTKIVQRAQHVPLAYIRGHAEFYGRKFAVNPHTLVPRPETETMVECLKALFPRHQARDGTGTITIIDIGTGSGAIAITAKLELPQAAVVATDIDKQCLETARANAAELGADVSFLRGNLLEPLLDMKVGLGGSTILCNLPYVPDNFQINTAASHEPRHALFGGTDGLDLYRELFAQLNSLTAKPLFILAESLPPQHELLTKIALAAGYELQQTDDFVQLFRAR
ncbi:MAG TPA: peptide chain release factor N(5)-glutamine methyltransferase [Candidatus Saccharimonadales bacterium]|nr:peptide chain release factor N(5)-glutamine methyltransferase [Candidatus Saccharimonadales bacterium]